VSAADSAATGLGVSATPDTAPKRGSVALSGLAGHPVVGCPDCGTILNAEAANCGSTWHEANRPAAVPSTSDEDVYQRTVKRITSAALVVANSEMAWEDFEEAVEAAVKEVCEVAQTCTCYDGNPANYEGAHADCAVHGAVRAFNDATRELAAARAEIAAQAATITELRAELKSWEDFDPDSIVSPQPKVIARYRMVKIEDGTDD